MDTRYMYHMLTTRYGYRPSDIVMLNEKSHSHEHHPTKYNILAAANWLLAGANYGD
eukprot:CAMPEP_0198455540 /NCGR_PEP_ID=MMETSP1453-20131121/19567_1 /TAXON_ID=1461543 ORGANISM="Unidentified sp., Strain RCC701" /NCGR_SAMPLE_ID=MMETSP1453 /ASSEMBLY_ACC=CAM_ASM_001118 /LENGTH=55 /DNA_ID=CAMNT_0044179903 /DNA_START=16 /DNA_END=180 /DNA_ORIENTATION=-